MAEHGAVDWIAKPRYRVERLTHPREIVPLLEKQRFYAAYAFGQLEPGIFALSQWWLVQGLNEQALLLHSRGGLGNALVAFGDGPALEAALMLHSGPASTFLTCQVEHAPAVQRHFWLRQKQIMMRMAVVSDDFNPVEGPARRLTGKEIYQVNELYNSEGSPSFYAPIHIDQGVYYGAYEGHKLVSIAGTHAISPTYGIAVVGNVFTHPRYRDRGYATVTTSAVTAELLTHCRDVVLTVDPANTPAVRAYRRLGYRDVGRLLETPALRHPLSYITAVPRRLFARWTGYYRHEPKNVQSEDML